MMDYKLKKRPKSPTIIQGFPSLGLVSTIVTKFLTDHLKVEEIGYIQSDKITPLTAIHNSKLMNPITFFYNKKYNLIIVQSITDVKGYEWEIAETMLKLAKEVKAKEVIVIEGIPSTQNNGLFKKKVSMYAYSNRKSKYTKDMAPLEEGVIYGVTASMMLKARKTIPLTCLFASANPNLPDSEAAAKVVKALDEKLGMNLDYKPLLKAAKKFEENMKVMMQKMQEQQLAGGKAPPMQQEQSQDKPIKVTKDKDLDYFG